MTEDETYLITLESDKVYGHRHVLLRVTAQRLDLIDQIGEKSVASFQYTKHHRWLTPKTRHNVAGHALNSGEIGKKYSM